MLMRTHKDGHAVNQVTLNLLYCFTQLWYQSLFKTKRLFHDPKLIMSTSNTVPPVIVSNLQNFVKLTNKNYSVWKMTIYPYLLGNNIYCFVDDTIPPSKTIPNTSNTDGAPPTNPNPEYQPWCQQDQTVLSLLVTTLSELVISNIIGCKTSQELLISLEKMFKA